ncbi:MAG TPA: cyclic nucleotide-binding domain-containing protein [Vicinamibacteria bacterium]|nr:cyclic nucleotide-binding domain-containing protein [Vicinamibacteria bacterium]
MLGWLTRLETVHKAETAAEREAIYRFRYQIYIEELKYNYEADHERKWLKQAEDEQPWTTLLYTGSPDDISSTVRVQAWKPGEVPPAVFALTSMERFPGIERLGVSHIGRMMIRRSLRGKLVLPSLLAGGYEFLVGEKGADLAFLDCVPGIVRHYRQLGARPYGGRLIDLGYSPGIPLVIVLSDYGHLKRSGSIVAPLVKKYFGPGKRAPLDLEPYRHLFDSEQVPVEFDPEKVWAALQDRLLAGDEAIPTFVDALSPGALFHLSESGYLLDVKAGDLITRAGIGQREMFVILEGACEVEGASKRIALLEKGDLFGEIAFFSESGERTATVRALSDCKLLVLRQKFLDELTTNDPEAACQILLNVSRIMAERMGGMVRAAAASAPDAEP